MDVSETRTITIKLDQGEAEMLIESLEAFKEYQGDIEGITPPHWQIVTDLLRDIGTALT